MWGSKIKLRIPNLLFASSIHHSLRLGHLLPVSWLLLWPALPACLSLIGSLCYFIPLPFCFLFSCMCKLPFSFLCHIHGWCVTAHLMRAFTRKRNSIVLVDHRQFYWLQKNDSFKKQNLSLLVAIMTRKQLPLNIQ